MKTFKLFFPFLLLALLFSACGAGTAVPTDETVGLEAVYTSAALTVSAQAAAATATPTSTPSPVATATHLASPTVMPTQAVLQVEAAPAPVVNSGGSTCDSSSFLSDVTIPDGTLLAPDEAFTKTWSYQNSGSCAWSTSYSLVFVSGDAMSGSTTALSSAVSSGGQINISVAMTAPSTTGTYTGYWKLQNAAGTSFGQAVYVQIVVSSDASTVTPTTTATDAGNASTSTATADSSTRTSTATSTSTPAPSATSAPTTITTSAPEPTSTSVPSSTETPSS